jgi:hypothetical protein
MKCYHSIPQLKHDEAICTRKYRREMMKLFLLRVRMCTQGFRDAGMEITLL